MQFIIKIGTPLEATLNLYIMPVFGALIAWLVLGQKLSWLAIAGGVLALIGIAQVNGLWQNLANRRKKQPPVIALPE